MTTGGRKAALDAIASEVRVCERCRLSRSRTQAVPGEGSPDTEVFFVGEGPGQREDEQGRPFVGPAGKLLEELLGLVGWRREDVFITNVVKCRPPGNRDPEPDEIEACRPYLQRQLEALDPALVVTLGRFSLQSFMPGERIGRAHGTTRPVDPSTGARDATALAMYHPAAALRQLALKETMQRDIAAVPATLVRARRKRAGGAASIEPAQPAAPSAPAAADGATDDAGDAAERPATDPVLGPATDLAEIASPRHDDQLGLF